MQVRVLPTPHKKTTMKDYNNMPHGRFFRATDALIEAYINNTLNAYDCTRCAVGNIVIKANGFTYNYWANWEFLPGTYYTSRHGVTQEFQEIALKEIQPTGYSAAEIVKVERIFLEKVGSCDTYDQETFDHTPALYAVFEYLYSLEDWEQENTEAKKVMEFFAVKS